MVADAIQQIESLTSADYVGALKRCQPTEAQWEMLRIHLAAPDQTITARHLARAIGFSDWHGANLHYGKFARKLCKELNVSPSTNLSALVEFFKLPGSEYELRLRPAVIEALKELGVSGHDTWQFQEELGSEEPLVEGASFTVRVNAFERNPVARQKCISHYGTGCAVCGFNFGAAYGGAADGYIHVHHLQPLASIGEEYVIDPIQDLRPVCANCHAVIHMWQPPYSIEEVKNMLKGDANA
ncbi:MAG: HNH endonuclease [Thiobacillus sp.]